jgi:sugar-specific transcriptional regulator TrmB
MSMSPGKNGNNPSIFSDFKLPEKRKTIEDMSLQDWMQKVHRLKSHNSKLEADLDKIQVQYEQTYHQKENIRKKAKELTEAVNGIFLKYDELESSTKWKDDEIELLQLRIGRLETDLTIARNSALKQQEHQQQQAQELMGSRSPIRQHSNFSTEHHHPHSPIDQSLPNSMSTTRPYAFSNASITQEEKILDLSQLLFEAQEREKSTIEENSRLKSRILELEGIVSGTSYYQAVKNTPSRPTSQRMTVGNEGDQQNNTNNGNSSNNSSAHNSTSRSEIQKLVSALQTAALPSSSSSNQNTPARSRLSSSSQLTTPIGLSSSHNKNNNNNASHHHFTYLESLLSPVRPNNGHSNVNEISLSNNQNNLLSTGRPDQLLEEEEEGEEQEQSERLIFQKNSTHPNQEDGNGK